jgi:hypothetical protein
MVDEADSEARLEDPAVEDVADKATEVDPTPRQQRTRSTIKFPYSDLGDVVEVVDAIYHQYGGRCSPDQLAAALNQTTTSGAFRIKISTAQMVGAIENHRGVLTLTDLGRRLADEETRPQALIEAFLNVELYKRIFGKYQGGRLPRDTGLEADMVAIGVAPKQASKARQAFQRSAEVAGFFWQGRDRLVAPVSGQAVTLPSMTPPDSVATDEQARAGEEVDDLRGRHALIVGLVRALPPEDEKFPGDKRKDWLQAATVIFNLVYGKAESEITADREPAKGQEGESAERVHIDR